MENWKQCKPLIDIKNTILQDGQKTKNFTPPLSDLDIIKLQTIFMTPSIHKITTENISSGRTLINTFLKSLRYYRNIGCLTTLPITLDNDTVNMYQLIQKYTHSFAIDQAIEDFFIDHSYFDFVWIEMAKDLLDQFVMQDIQRMCEILTTHGSIPVVMIQYKKS